MYTLEIIQEKLHTDDVWLYKAGNRLFIERSNLLSESQKSYLEAFYKYYTTVEIYISNKSKNSIILEHICKSYILELVDIANGTV